MALETHTGDLDSDTAADGHGAKTPSLPVMPLCQKLCYAIGGVPYQMTNIALGFSLQIFLLDVVQMDAFYVSLILFLGRAWDAVTDPLVGYLVSRSARTRAGKLLPWAVLSMPLGVFSYIMLWFTPQGSASPGFSFFWHLSMSCLFETFMSCYHVPYSSLCMFLGGHQRHRDSATAYRMGVEVFAMLMGALIQGQVVGVLNAERDQACTQWDRNEHLPQSTAPPRSDTMRDTRMAFLLSALVVGGLYSLCCLLLFLGVKEQMAPLTSMEVTHVPYLSSLKKLIKHTPYLWLVFGFLFASLAYQTSLGNLALFFTHVAGLGTYFQYFILVLLMVATLSVPVWQMLLVRIGKKTTLFIGLTVFIPPLVLIPSIPSSLPLHMAMSVLGGCSLAALFLLPWSMLPDVVDDFKVRNPSCRDLEPLFFSCYVFCSKLGGGLSVGISTLALHFAGYEASACSHSTGVVITLRVLLGPVPLVLLLVGMVLFYRYPIHEAQRCHMPRELQTAVEENISSAGLYTPGRSLKSSHRSHASSHQSYGSSFKTDRKSEVTWV